MSEELFQELAQVVISGDIEKAEALARQAVAQGLDAHACINQGVLKGIQRVGRLAASGEYPLPDLLSSADAAGTVLKVLEPDLIGDHKKEVIGLVVLRPLEADQGENGKIIFGTMLGDQELSAEQNIPFLQWLA
jgi:methanogenic corrinoid protein MtbC1